MRARRLAISLVLPFFAACNCGGTHLQHATSVLVMSPKSLDFGVGCLNATSEQQILLENTGTVPIDIDATKSTVSGVSFTLLAPLPASLDPGQQVAVRVGFTPPTADEFAGAFDVVTDAETNGTQHATLVGNGSNLPDVDFEVTCPQTAGDSQLQPCNDLEFDNIPAGQTADRVAHLANNGCGNLTVQSMSFYPDPQAYPDPTSSQALSDARLFSTPKDQAPFVLRGGEARDVTVRFSPPPKLSLTPNIRMKIVSTDPQPKNGGTDPGVWELGMFANSVAPALSVDPTELTFFHAQTGTPESQTFTVINSGTAGLNGVGITIKPDGGTKAFTLGPSGPETETIDVPASSSKDVTVTYTPEQATVDKATVLVTATTPGGTETASVTLIGGTDPELVVKWLDPTTGAEQDPPIDFGQTATGAKGLTRTVRLENAGSATLHVSSVTIPASTNPMGSYSIPTFAAASVAPAGHDDLVVTFNDAVSLANDSAKLRIVSDDPSYASNGGAYEVDLLSENTPNFPPVPKITVCAHQAGSSQCTTAPQVGMVLTLDGSGSTGPEATDTLTFQWALTNKPAGSTATLSTPTNIKTDVANLNVKGNYVVTLTVTDQFAQSSSVSQAIAVAPQ